MRASVAAEKAGVATVPVVESGFLGIANAIGNAFGVALPIAEYPGDYKDDQPETQRAKLRGPVVDAIVASLAQAPQAVGAPAEPGPREIVFRGTLDEVGEHFTRQLWT